MNTESENLIEAVRLVQGVDISHEDVAAIKLRDAEESQYGQRMRYEGEKDPCAWSAPYEVTDGKVLKIAASVGLGFLTGGFLGGAIALAGSLFGGGQRRQGQDRAQKEEEVFNQDYGFQSGGALAIAGTPIPLAYGSRSLSIDRSGALCGGVRSGGILLNSRIVTSAGKTYLFQLWSLGAGQSPFTGIGQIRHIASNEIIFDKQPRKNFGSDQIRTQIRPGSVKQSNIYWFSDYSENLSPSSYESFGVDQRVSASSGGNTTQGDPQNGINVLFSQDDGDIAKKGNTDLWDAYSWAEDAIGANSFFSFKAGQIGKTKAAGVSGFQGAVRWEDLDHGFFFYDNVFAVVESGSILFRSANYTANTVFQVRVSGDLQITYWVDNTQVWISKIQASPALYANLLFAGSGSRFDRVHTSIKPNGIREAYAFRTSFSVATANDVGKLGSEDNYVLTGGQPGRDAPSFRIFQKNLVNRTITTDSPVTIQSGANIYAWWECVFETTKHISNIELNFVFNVNARTQDNSAFTTHGVMFDIWVRKANQKKNSDQRVGRFYVRSRVPKNLYRAIRVENLPLGRYIFTIRPQTVDPQDERVYELLDNGTTVNDVSTANIGGNSIRIEGEFQNISEPGNINSAIALEMSYSNKAQVSSQSGPTGRLQSVNQLVSVKDAGTPSVGNSNPYPGLSLLGIRYESSEQLQRSPGLSIPQHECRSIPNLMAAGSSSGLSSIIRLSDPSASFIADGIKAGWVLRNLSKGLESRISNVASTAIDTDDPLDWRTGDRYLVYFEAASPFFPDIAADLGSSEHIGVGDKISRDDDIDYESFVRSRKFCKAKKLYWNGFVQAPPTPYIQWIETEAVGSLLISGRINGRIALFPEELPTKAPYLFNDANSRDAVLQWPSYERSRINRLIIRYTDMRDLIEEDGARGRLKIVVISTLGAFNGSEIASEQTLDIPAVTSPLQAIDAGVVFFNSARKQTHGIEFVAGPDAAYLEGGDIISYQSATHDVGEQYSSFVIELEPFNPTTGTQKVRLSEQPVLFEGLADGIPATDGSAFLNVNLEESAIAPGDLLLNVSTGASTIVLNRTRYKITAPMVTGDGDLIQVINLTQPLGLSCRATYRTTGYSQQGIQYAYERRGSLVWLSLSGLQEPLEKLDRINIGPPSTTYKVQRISPNGPAEYKITGVYHPMASLYSSAGLVMEYDTEVIFG
jgi:hypothetical protein